MFVTSATAFLAVAAMTVDLAWRSAWGWPLAWSVGAAAVSLLNARAGIEVMSAFDWRPLPRVSIVSVAVVAAWLALP